MKTLKQQLTTNVANMLVANIGEGYYTMNVDYTYTTNERIICLDCDSGEANLITTHNVRKVTIKDGDILTLDEYMIMQPFEQAAWDTLYENLYLSVLYKNEDTDGDGVPDTLFRYDTVTDTYYPVDAKTYVLQSDIDELRSEGNMDEESLNGSISISSDALGKQPPADMGPFINNIHDDAEIMHLRIDADGNLVEKTPSEVNKSIREHNQGILKGKL